MTPPFTRKSVQDKVLVCGNVDGRFEPFLARLEQICAKFSGAEKFEQVFVCGEFFGPDVEENKRMLNGDYIVPLPLYILGSAKMDRARYYKAAAGENLGPNITYLGHKGVYTTASGLKIAYLSGVQGEYQDECHFSAESVRDLVAQVTAVANFRGIDILLTTQWPAGLEKYTNHTPDVANDDQLQVSPLISRLAAALKPQYHFAALAECHYERPPYRNHRVLQESASLYHMTRFVGLARCGNPSRCKWLYAFNVTPCSVSRAPGGQWKAAATLVTECPFDDVIGELEAKEKAKRSATRATLDQYFFDQAPWAAEDERLSGQRNGRKKKRREDDQPPKPCWFCLASPQVEKHLVLSIGEHAYLALAKGPLVDDHVLLTPVGHVQSLASCQDADLLQEIDRYKRALRDFYAQSDLVPIFFERNWRTQHLQLQCVAVSSAKSEELGEIFRQKFLEHSISFDLVPHPETTTIGDLLAPGQPYFYVELPNGQKMFASKIEKNFPLNFGREVLSHAELLNLSEEKIDWKRCVLSREEECDLANKFKTAFRPFDFTNE